MATYPAIDTTFKTTDVTNWVPNPVWKDEILAVRDAQYGAMKFFKQYPHRNAPGTELRILTHGNMTARDKTSGTPVVPDTIEDGGLSITIDKHKYVSSLIEDIAARHSMLDVRKTFTNRAGLALRAAIETDIWALFDANLAAAYKVIGSDGATQYAAAGAGNFASITDAGLRRMIRTLEDNNVDPSELTLWITPGEKSSLLAIDKFTLFQYIGRTSELQKGLFGSIYGVTVRVATTLPVITAADTTTTGRLCVLTTNRSVCSAPALDIRFESQRQLQDIGTLVVAEMEYGVKALRVSASDTQAASTSTRKSEAVGIYVPA